MTRCENAVAKNVGKLMAGLIKCHIARASGKLVDDTAEEACEATAQTKFQVTNPQGCTACTNLVALSATVETLIDNANGLAYCAP